MGDKIPPYITPYWKCYLSILIDLYNTAKVLTQLGGKPDIINLLQHKECYTLSKA